MHNDFDTDTKMISGKKVEFSGEAGPGADASGLPQDENKLIAERREKLSALRTQGIAFPNDFHPDAFAGDLQQEFEGKDVETIEAAARRVKVAGRMLLKRGQGKGMVIETVLSDYTEVNGLMFPYAITVKMNGQTGQSMVIEKVETNPTLDAKLFAFPEGK